MSVKYLRFHWRVLEIAVSRRASICAVKFCCNEFWIQVQSLHFPVMYFIIEINYIRLFFRFMRLLMGTSALCPKGKLEAFVAHLHWLGGLKGRWPCWFMSLVPIMKDSRALTQPHSKKFNVNKYCKFHQTIFHYITSC